MRAPSAKKIPLLAFSSSATNDPSKSLAQEEEGALFAREREAKINVGGAGEENLTFAARVGDAEETLRELETVPWE